MVKVTFVIIPFNRDLYDCDFTTNWGISHFSGFLGRWRNDAFCKTGVVDSASVKADLTKSRNLITALIVTTGEALPSFVFFVTEHYLHWWPERRRLTAPDVDATQAGNVRHQHAE